MRLPSALLLATLVTLSQAAEAIPAPPGPKPPLAPQDSTQDGPQDDWDALLGPNSVEQVLPPPDHHRWHRRDPKWWLRPRLALMADRISVASLRAGLSLGHDPGSYYGVQQQPSITLTGVGGIAATGADLTLGFGGYAWVPNHLALGLSYRRSHGDSGPIPDGHDLLGGTMQVMLFFITLEAGLYHDQDSGRNEASFGAGLQW
ncbi:MAG: hypothetical protein PF961_10205 [Planctomycetota bacterium]|jgi:hypothetical protein|nr:hypothetical protein [Planctomycetota bacterium]